MPFDYHSIFGPIHQLDQPYPLNFAIKDCFWGHIKSNLVQDVYER